MATPPAFLIAQRPALPSASIPLRIIPATELAYTAAAERNKTLTAGRL